MTTATFNNLDVWNNFVSKNKSSYGGGVITYAERWATLMEKKIAEGAKLEEIANAASNEADTEGITRFMYVAAVAILIASEWIYAEELLRWHNGKYGVADAEGVVNPAVINIDMSE